MARKNPLVDAYIARSAEFARPILKHLRRIVHAGCPGVEETLKWSAPTFMYKGILCGMAAFQKHCIFGFWKEALLRDRLRGAAGSREKAMGQFGRITKVSELPDDAVLLALVREAAALNEQGIKSPTRSRPKGPRELNVPDYFMDSLRANGKALATFERFNYTDKKEYVDWVTEAKRDETRRRRLETAAEWMAQGRIRNWKYVRSQSSRPNRYSGSRKPIARPYR